MHGLFKQLARQIHARLRRVDVLVQIQHQVVADNRVAGGKESDEALDQVLLRRIHLLAKVGHVRGEVDFFHRPRVLNPRLVHFVEDGVLHRAQSQVKAGIENHTVFFLFTYWHASQLSGFSREQAMAWDAVTAGAATAAAATGTVALDIFDAGRERR